MQCNANVHGVQQLLLFINLGISTAMFMMSLSSPLDNYNLLHGSSTRGPRAACGPRASFVRPGKGISQNTMRYEF